MTGNHFWFPFPFLVVDAQGREHTERTQTDERSRAQCDQHCKNNVTDVALENEQQSDYKYPLNIMAYLRGQLNKVVFVRHYIINQFRVTTLKPKLIRIGMSFISHMSLSNNLNLSMTFWKTNNCTIGSLPFTTPITLNRALNQYDWLNAWLIDWLLACLLAWLIDWLIDRLIDLRYYIS